MRYLEQNGAVLEELRDHTFVKSPITAWTSSVNYHTAGSFSSEVLDREVFLGLKVSKYGLGDTELDFERAFVFFSECERLAPHYVDPKNPIVPSVYGIIVDGNGDSAIVTEDFSQGGKKKVCSIQSDQVPADFRNLPWTADYRNDIEEMSHCFFSIDDVLRIGDFNTQQLMNEGRILPKGYESRKETIFDPYTIKIEQKLIWS